MSAAAPTRSGPADAVPRQRAGLRAAWGTTSEPWQSSPWWRDGPLWAGLAVVALLAIALRWPALTAHLPDLTAPDESTTVDRAVAALNGRFVPPRWDWPPGAAFLLAGVLALGPASWAEPDVVYTVGRHVFAVVSVLLVVSTGLLAHAVTPGPRGRAVAWTAAAAVAVSYLTVRGGRTVHPDQLQMLLMVVGVGATVAYRRCERHRLGWLATAAVLGGLAGAVKYLGVLVAVPITVAVLQTTWPRPARTGGHLGLAAALMVGGFLLGTLGAPLMDPAHTLEGFGWQVAHQTTGHLGYEPRMASWLYHLTRSLPGTWGWMLTLLGLAGTGWFLWRGRSGVRLVAALTVPLLAFPLWSGVHFPHYVQPALPFLAVAGVCLVDRCLAGVGSRAAVIGFGLLCLTLVPAAVGDVRLIRATASPDTRLLAGDLVEAYRSDDGIWAESYTTPERVRRRVPAHGYDPEVVTCGCVALTSSFMEDRFRARPDRYADGIAVYDELFRRGEVLAVVRPDHPVGPGWTLLPGEELSRVPLIGPVGATGPTVTALDLRDVDRVSRR